MKKNPWKELFYAIVYFIISCGLVACISTDNHVTVKNIFLSIIACTYSLKALNCLAKMSPAFFDE